MHLKALGGSLAAAYVLFNLGELRNKWQALQYLYHRMLCEDLEEKYPGIAGDAGYDFELQVLANLPADPMEQEATGI